jgi:glutamine transport system permease protein
MDFEWSVIIEALPALAQGAKLTIFITVAGLTGGVAVGLLLGLLRAYGNKPLAGIAFGIIELVRGTPIVVQVMFIYFALPVLMNLRVDALTAAVVTIIVNSGAYIAEIVRGAFLSVPRGLREAGLALGLPMWRVLAFVIGPVALRRMTPPMGNQFIISLKDTSLFIVIGVGELTRQGQEIMAANFRAVEVWSAVAIIYLVMISLLSFCLRLVEKRMRVL